MWNLKENTYTTQFPLNYGLNLKLFSFQSQQKDKYLTVKDNCFKDATFVDPETLEYLGKCTI